MDLAKIWLSKMVYSKSILYSVVLTTNRPLLCGSMFHSLHIWHKAFLYIARYVSTMIFIPSNVTPPRGFRVHLKKIIKKKTEQMDVNSSNLNLFQLQIK